MDKYLTRKEIARQNVTYDRIEMYINYVLSDLENYEKVLEKFKNENKDESAINGIRYKIDYAKYVLGLINERPYFREYTIKE